MFRANSGKGSQSLRMPWPLLIALTTTSGTAVVVPSVPFFPLIFLSFLFSGLFFHSFNSSGQSTYCVPGIELGTGHATVSMCLQSPLTGETNINLPIPQVNVESLTSMRAMKRSPEVELTACRGQKMLP